MVVGEVVSFPGAPKVRPAPPCRDQKSHFGPLREPHDISSPPCIEEKILKGSLIQGYLAHRKTPTPLGPP